MPLSCARDSEIWNPSGHLAPNKGDNRSRGQLARTRLGDREQVTAFAEGRAEPALSEEDAAGDLLDVDEVAARYGKDPLTRIARVARPTASNGIARGARPEDP